MAARSFPFPSLAYRFNNGVPNQLTMRVNPQLNNDRVKGTALYAQDQWSVGRFSMQGALRYDRAWSYNVDAPFGPSRFVPNPTIIRASKGVDALNDISLRGGMTYDLFGNKKTSLRVSAGQYRDALQVGGIFNSQNPIALRVTSTNRNWTDSNRDFVPDCDLMNPATNGECGAWSNQLFGSTNPGTKYDPRLLNGWGVRPADTQLAVGVQRELLPRLSAEVTYHRRWFGNFTATDNLLVKPSDYDPYSIVAPADSRLPGGGGYTIDDLWEISSTKFGQSDDFVAPADDYGNRISYWHGVDVNISGRMRNSLMFQGGTSTGRAVTDTCDVTPKLDSPSQRFCRTVAPFATQFKGLMSYTIPKVDVQVSSTIQSLPGASLAANLVVPSAQVAQTLGRPSVGKRGQRDRESHRAADDVWRSHQPGRFPYREGFAIRTQSGTSGRRHLQRDELQRPAGVPPDVRVDLAEANFSVGRPLRAGEWPDRFLIRCRLSSAAAMLWR
jgi:hypothetical protein